jgi:ABC-type uncharacterized transport system auxiliary subunit
MKKHLLLLLFGVLLAGCFSLRTPFIPINYYYLQQENFSFKSIAQIEAFVVYKDFSVPDELYDNRLMIWYDDGTVQKLNYHRFAADYHEILNNFIFSRFNLSNAFKYGIATLGSSIVPDYIIEGKILGFKAIAKKNDKKQNWVIVEIQVSLIKYKPLSSQNTIVFSKTYSQRIEVNERDNSKFVQSFSHALSLTVDKMILDIQSAIAHDNETEH